VQGVFHFDFHDFIFEHQHLSLVSRIRDQAFELLAVSDQLLYDSVECLLVLQARGVLVLVSKHATMFRRCIWNFLNVEHQVGVHSDALYFGSVFWPIHLWHLSDGCSPAVYLWENETLSAQLLVILNGLHRLNQLDLDLKILASVAVVIIELNGQMMQLFPPVL